MKVFFVGRAQVTAIAVVFVSAAAAVTAGCDGDEGTGATTASTSASTTSGGEGGSGGAGAGTGGQGGGAAGACLDPKDFAELFTIEDADLCAVAIYTADIALKGETLTWGSHNGLLTINSSATEGSVDITRWSTPSGSSGALMPKTTEVKATIPAGAFVGEQAIDLPFFGWTAVSWTPAFPATTGEVILLEGDVVAARYDVNGFFSGAGIGASAQGRLLYSGLSALEDTAGSTNALYAADTCGAVGQDPRLIPKADAACKAPGAVATWGDSSGPVAVDIKGNVFAVMSNFGTKDQEARGFEASTVAKGAPMSNGVTLFTLPGFGSPFAALSPDASGMGLIALQPTDATSFEAQDVIEQRFSASAGALKAEGTTSVLLKLTTPATSLAMTSDDKDRLWVSGPKGADGTLIVVLARLSK